MAAAKRLDPKDYFSPSEWASLSRRSSWRGLLLVAHCWVVILGAGLLFILWPNPLTLILAIMIIGARQLGLAILMHDAAHAAIHPTLSVNDWVANWLCGAPIGASLHTYRPYHLTHHRFAQQPEDPDLSLSAPFPITPLSLRRKLMRDLTGQTFFKQRIRPTVESLLPSKSRAATRSQALAGVLKFWRNFAIANGVLLSLLSIAGVWWAYPVLWLLPMATWYPLVTRLRNIAEHACVSSNDDPLLHARTTRAGVIERLLIAPYFVNYHCEHHMFMHLPCWSLPKAHRLLARTGVTARMEIKDHYFGVMRLAAGRRTSGDSGSDAQPPRSIKEPSFAAPFG